MLFAIPRPTVLLLVALVFGGPTYNVMKESEPVLAGFVPESAVPTLRVPGRAMVNPEGPRLTPGAGAALAWVNQHTEDDAVVATNRHCETGPERPGCRAIASWVSGLGGRRTVIEGWGYTSKSRSWVVPSPFPERLAINNAVFTDPSVTTIERLRDRYGASWLVADTSAAPVSSELARFAVPRFRSGEVTVYQLR